LENLPLEQESVHATVRPVMAEYAPAAQGSQETTPPMEK
jgi:hypothetical protein